MKPTCALALAWLLLLGATAIAQPPAPTDWLDPKSVELGPLGEIFTLVEVRESGAATSLLFTLKAKKDVNTAELDKRYSVGLFDKAKRLGLASPLAFLFPFPLERDESIWATCQFQSHLTPEGPVPWPRIVIRRVK